MYDADPLRSLPKAQQRRVHRAVILGRPVAPELAAVAAGHARHLRWMFVAGAVVAALGAAMLAAAAFAPHATWLSWLMSATYLIWGAIFLFSASTRGAQRGWSTIHAAEDRELPAL